MTRGPVDIATADESKAVVMVVVRSEGKQSYRSPPRPQSVWRIPTCVKTNKVSVDRLSKSISGYLGVIVAAHRD